MLAHIDEILVVRLDVDKSADLTVPELKRMRDAPEIQMPDESMAGMRLPYFTASFSKRMRQDIDAADAFETLDGDGNGLLTRKEARAAKQFFRDDLR